MCAVCVCVSNKYLSVLCTVIYIETLVLGLGYTHRCASSFLKHCTIRVFAIVFIAKLWCVCCTVYGMAMCAVRNGSIVSELFVRAPARRAIAHLPLCIFKNSDFGFNNVI